MSSPPPLEAAVFFVKKIISIFLGNTQKYPGNTLFFRNKQSNTEMPEKSINHEVPDRAGRILTLAYRSLVRSQLAAAVVVVAVVVVEDCGDPGV